MKKWMPVFIMAALAAGAYFYLDRQKHAGKLPPLSGGTLASI